ncbi:MAG: glycoside hydrolase family 65 protein [Ruminococcaceae bacterium]|nr:glycoside hydrolase family 65 protein [Oscillospiraceae bacterium]
MNWIVQTNEYKKDLVPHNGNKFLTGNGFFGVRGTMEETKKDNMCAINLAGVYDRAGDGWRESVNAPNVLYTVVEVDDKEYALPEAEPKSHEQILDFYNAIHKRKTIWTTEKGEITVEAERFASMANQSVIALKYSVSTDYDCKIRIKSGIDGDVWDINGPHFVKLEVSENNGVKTVVGTTGEKSHIVTAKEYIKADFNCDRKINCDSMSAIEEISFDAKSGEIYTIEKVASVIAPVFSEDIDVSRVSYDELKNAHIKAWEKIWDISTVEIIGDDEAMYALNYSIYHLNIIAPRNMDNVSIAARGLSGQVYKGAVFWDTEMFMIDYFIHTDPAVAKTLIDYRIDTLQGARNKAKEYGLEGAYYAWESQEGGFEGCSDYNITDVFTKRPMRTYFRDKQYHVSAAVVYGICKYIDATGDTSVFENGGAEAIIECARMYRSLLLKRADSKFYEVRDVVGPDEYHERVSNNAYTNKMVKLTFETAIDAIKTLENEYADKYNELDKKYDLKTLEERFKDSAENILIKEPDERGLIEQFDGYFNLEDATVDEVRSRLLDPKEYWGGAYGVASDTQVLKQADVVAMLGIFGNEYDKEILKKNFDYYEPRTEHGSSLSACMYSLLACQIGNAEIAYPLFMKSAGVDLKPGGKEWMGLIYIGGTHPASEGGAWIVAVKGFAGINIENGKLNCNPCLPEKWQGMKFKLMFMDKLYQVEINKNGGNITEV